MAKAREVGREVLSIADRPFEGLTTNDAKDPDTSRRGPQPPHHA